MSLFLQDRLERWPAFLALGLLVLAVASCSRTNKERQSDPDLINPKLVYEPLAPGVERADYFRTQPVPLSYHVVRANLDQGGLSLGVLHLRPDSKLGRGTVAEMVRAITTPERRVAAAISGDYFGNGMAGPWGIQLLDGRLVYSPQGRSAFMIDPGGRPLIANPQAKLQVRIGDDPVWLDVCDMNRPKRGCLPGMHLYSNTREVSEAPAPQGAVLIDADLPLVGGVVTGRVTRLFTDGKPVPLPRTGLVLACGGKTGDPVLPTGIREGLAVQIRTDLVPHAREAVGGGPRIVRDGKVSIELKADGICAAEAAYLKRPHPRAVVGISRDGRRVYLLVVRGRCKESVGLELPDLADLMIGLGSSDAIMFDGGDSATIFENDYVIRGRGGPRAMCNGLAILVPQDAGTLGEGGAQ
jgi:hypothetical protein